jgi:hypothetical protein
MAFLGATAHSHDRYGQLTKSKMSEQAENRQ